MQHKGNQPQKIYILNSTAYHVIGFSKQSSNYCARDFTDYIKNISNIPTAQICNNLTTKIISLTSDEKIQRQIIQACNLGLSLQSAQVLFPKIFSENRMEVQQILRQASTKS